MRTGPLPGVHTARRTLLKAGAGALLCEAAAHLDSRSLFGSIAQAATATGASNKILVVLELSGGNDGLNTVIPYSDDAYYRMRPKIGIKPGRIRKIDERFGFNPGMAGFERLYKDGKLAIVHGCGYDDPSFSHFTSMAYWHTAAPNSADAYGWVGRLADTIAPPGAGNPIVNIGASQSLAVLSRVHTPVVFEDPTKFQRKSFFQERGVIDMVGEKSADDTANHRYLTEVARSARETSALVRDAWSKYKTPVDYGIVPVDLPKVAALIAAGLPTRLYYVTYRNNSFDTHVHQSDVHERLLTYVSDAVNGFVRDMDRIGRGGDVVVMAFSEFGRRVPENTSLGTDHGTAGPMFIVGAPVKGGHYGQPVSLTSLTPDDNLIHTSDFRRTYATVVDRWLGVTDTRALLHGTFETFPVFA